MSGKLPSGVRRLLRLGSVDRDLDEELASHFEHTIDELMARGYEDAYRQFIEPFLGASGERVTQIRSAD